MASDGTPAWIEDESNQQELLAKVLRLGLSACGPVGVIVGEFVTEFIPRQRIDRLQEFTELLAERVADLQEQLKEKLKHSAAFVALAEEVSVAAVRAHSSERRRDLAALLKNGISKTDAEMIAHQALLKLLEQLNDAQILILMRYGSFRPHFGNQELAAFMDAHPEVFSETPPALGDDDEEAARRWVMYQYYGDAMATLGLLRDTEGLVKGGPYRKWAITKLGEMLLEAIDQPVAVL